MVHSVDNHNTKRLLFQRPLVTVSVGSEHVSGANGKTGVN